MTLGVEWVSDSPTIPVPIRGRRPDCRHIASHGKHSHTPDRRPDRPRFTDGGDLAATEVRDPGTSLGLDDGVPERADALVPDLDLVAWLE